MTQNGISPHVCVETRSDILFWVISQAWVILKTKSCWATISDYIRNPTMKLNEYGISEYAKNHYPLDAHCYGSYTLSARQSSPQSARRRRASERGRAREGAVKMRKCSQHISLSLSLSLFLSPVPSFSLAHMSQLIIPSNDIA